MDTMDYIVYCIDLKMRQDWDEKEFFVLRTLFLEGNISLVHSH